MEKDHRDMYGPQFVEQISRSTMDWYHQLAVRQLRDVFTDLRQGGQPDDSSPRVLADIGSNIHPSLESVSSRVAFEYAFPNGRYVGVDLERAAFTADYLTQFREVEYKRLWQEDNRLADRWLATYCPREQRGISGHAIVGSAEALPLASNSVDIVLFSDVLEHVVDYHQALAETSRTLRPDGSLCLVIPQMYNLNIVQALPHAESLINKNYFTTTHINFWTPDTLGADLQRHDLTIVDSKPVGLLMGAAWLLQLDESYAWGQTRYNEFTALNTTLAELFAWDQIDAHPFIDSCPGMQHIDAYFRSDPAALQQMISDARDPIDLLQKMMGAALAIYPYVDPMKVEKARQEIELLQAAYDRPLAAEKFKSIQPLLGGHPLALANDVIFVASRISPP